LLLKVSKKSRFYGYYFINDHHCPVKKHFLHLSAQATRAFTFSPILMYYFYGIHDPLRASDSKNQKFCV